MTDLRRTIRCSNCGNESSITVSSEIDVKELLFSGKCRCGSSMQVTYNIVGGDSQVPAPEQPAESAEEPQTVNVSETLFGTDSPSDNLRDLMED